MSTTPRPAEAQFFKPNQAMLPDGPARPAEVVAAGQRNRIAQQAMNASRDLKDALVMCRQLDKTGNFDGGLDHVLATWAQVNVTMEKLRVAGITFLAMVDDLEGQDAA